MKKSGNIKDFASFRNFASFLGQRTQLSALLGKMFHGQRDMYKVYGYDRVISYEKVLARYRRQDITTRIVDAPADALWSNPPEIKSNNDAWNKVWQDLVINHNLWNVVQRVDRMAGMGDFAVLLLGLDKSTLLSEPAVLIPGRKVLYLQPYGLDMTEITQLYTDPANSLYLTPEQYRISPRKSTMTTDAKIAVPAFQLHSSRVIHVAENCLADTIYGNPRVERVYNLLDDLMKVVGGTAETFWLTANRGLQIDIDKEMELTPEDEDDLSDEIDEYANQLRRIIRTRGVKINPLGSDVPDPKNLFDILISLISGTTGIPKRILLGSEAGQLASSEDRANWAERIEDRRKNFGEPSVIWPLIRQLTQVGVLPGDAGVTIEIKWPDAFKLAPLERAQTSAQKARSASNLAKTLTTTPDLLSVDEARGFMELGASATVVKAEDLTKDGVEG